MGGKTEGKDGQKENDLKRRKKEGMERRNNENSRKENGKKRRENWKKRKVNGGVAAQVFHYPMSMKF